MRKTTLFFLLLVTAVFMAKFGMHGVRGFADGH
jgi:hypothetical protein